MIIARNNDTTNASDKAVSRKDAILYLLCGLVGDALPGFFFSATVNTYLDIPDNDTAVLGLSANVGGIAGVLITTFVLSRLVPDARVVINASLQVTGILLSWLLPYPSNCIAGISILTIGFQGVMATIMPLSTLSGEYATRSYQAGYALAPILGIALVKIGVAANFDKNAAFGAVLIFPFVSTVSYFFIDHSKYGQDENEMDHSAIMEAGDESLNAASANFTSLGEPLLSDSREQPQAENRPSMIEGAYRRLSYKAALDWRDYITASKEMMIRYWPADFVAVGFYTFFTDALYNPLVTSSATYAGEDDRQVKDTANTISLISHIVTAAIGVSILTPLADAISKQSPYFLWGPALLVIALTLTALFGVAYGAFPPAPIPATSIICIFTSSMWFFVVLFSPLFVVNDKKLNPRYHQFQAQTILLVFNIGRFLTDLIIVTKVDRLVLEGCKSNYKDEFRGVSCVF